MLCNITRKELGETYWNETVNDQKKWKLITKKLEDSGLQVM